MCCGYHPADVSGTTEGPRRAQQTVLGPAEVVQGKSPLKINWDKRSGQRKEDSVGREGLDTLGVKPVRGPAELLNWGDEAEAGPSESHVLPFVVALSSNSPWCYSWWASIARPSRKICKQAARPSAKDIMWRIN